jgi:hypothetical protein
MSALTLFTDWLGDTIVNPLPHLIVPESGSAFVIVHDRLLMG